MTDEQKDYLLNFTIRGFDAVIQRALQGGFSPPAILEVFADCMRESGVSVVVEEPTARAPMNAN